MTRSKSAHPRANSDTSARSDGSRPSSAGGAERSAEPHASPQPRLLVAAALVWMGERLLVQRRPPTARHGADSLELPGGKLERGESPRAALARELCEEWGPAARELEIGAVAEVLHHVYPPPGPEVILIVLHVNGDAWAQGRWRACVEPEPGVEVLAFDCAQLPLDEFLAADRPFLRAVAEGQVRRQPC